MGSHMTNQESIVLLMAGTAITTIGVLSLWAHFASALSRTRTLLWFGLFAAPYGLAVICRSIFLPGAHGRTEWLIIVFGKLVGLISSVPALLLFQEFYGKGGRLPTKWLIWMYGFAVAIVLVLILAHDRPRSIPSPGIALVILVPLSLMVDRFTGYRPPPIQNRLIIFGGLLGFFITFAYDHLSHWRDGNERAITEPFGFIALTLCLGYVVSCQVARNEAEWLSMAGEMQAARKIQAAILPVSMPTIAGYSIAACYSPMTAVAGDFYGFPSVHPNSFGIILGDVMGHGVPAALIASMVKVSVFASAERKERPGQIVCDLNGTLCREAPGQYATGVYVSLDRETGIGVYCAAGQPPTLLWRRQQRKLEALDAAGLLLGARNGESYEDSNFNFETGDRLLIYSDGLTEAENREAVSFGDARLPTLISSMENLTAEEFAALLREEVLTWSAKGSGMSQSDDITFVVIDAV